MRMPFAGGCVTIRISENDPCIHPGNTRERAGTGGNTNAVAYGRIGYLAFEIMGAASFRHLRHAAGLSQPAFAKLLNCSADTIASVEQGRLGVSERLARSAFVACGCIPAMLVAGDSLYPEAIAWDRLPYTPRHFTAWRAMIGRDLLATVRGGGEAARFTAVVGVLLAAAREAGRLGEVQAALTLDLFEMAFDLGLHVEARDMAHRSGCGEDFDFLASVAGRIEPPR